MTPRRRLKIYCIIFAQGFSAVCVENVIFFFQGNREIIKLKLPSLSEYHPYFRYCTLPYPNGIKYVCTTIATCLPQVDTQEGKKKSK